MPATLVILNPFAGNGRIHRQWPRIEAHVADQLGELRVVETWQPGNVIQAIDQAYQDSIRRVVSVGGDGSNFEMINALAYLRRQFPTREPMIFGTLPAGTGRDWARSRSIPLQPIRAAAWLKDATPRPVDVGHLEIDGNRENPLYFLNIASAGISGDVDLRVSRVRQKRPWTFLRATIGAIIGYQSQPTKVILDGETWFDQSLKLVAVANGTTFGHGMRIAPNAQIDDGILDVIVIEDMSRVRMLWKLWHVYNASHLTESGVHFRQAHTVEIELKDKPAPIDLDGEMRFGQQLKFSVERHALVGLV